MRSGFCAIVGRPNVGKSTLLNSIVKQKVAAVTPKPQTTRDRIRGICNAEIGSAAAPEAAQIVFVDTPGIHQAKSELNRYMVEQALGAAAETDAILLVVEAESAAAPGANGEETVGRLGPAQKMIVESLSALKKPTFLAINKIDLLRDKAALLAQIALWKDQLPFVEIFPISAFKGDQVESLVKAIGRKMPPGEALFPDDQITDRAERFLAAEAIREQLFLQLREEVPYGTAVTIDRFDERGAKSTRSNAGGNKGGQVIAPSREVAIDATIHIARQSQKKIVIGKGGAAIKELGIAARKEIGVMLDCTVHLKLWVKVDPDWVESRAALRRLGYE